MLKAPILLLVGSLLSVAPATLAGSRALPAWDDPLLSRGFDARGAKAPRMAMILGRGGAALTEASKESAETMARRFVLERLHAPGEWSLAATAEGGGGVRFVTLQQRFAGVEVMLGRVGVAVAPDGRVLAARVGEIARAAPRPSRAAVDSASGAFAAARRAFGRAKDAPLGPAPEAAPVLFATEDGCVRAWRVRFMDGGQADRGVQAVIDAGSGTLLRADSMSFPGVARAQVVPRDPTVGLASVTLVDPVLAPSVDSPAGWTAALETAGNNAWVQLDREGDFFPPYGPTATASGTPPALDFAYTGDPRADADLALTNVFWAINEMHDRFRRLGFDEASGACQADSFDRGGAPGDDRVWALVQYASVDGSQPYNGVSMGVGPDGSFTWLAVGVFEDASGVLRDGALETDLLFHELAHQVSTRLVGDDPACMNGAQPQALSEGWSDFFAASFTNDQVIGAFTAGRPAGQRTGPIGATGVSLVNLCEAGACNRFNDGEIWAGTLWDVRQALIARMGRAAGVEYAERLAVEGMRYTPCRPTFQQARDGIILADGALSGGARRCDLWQSFVNRGMGFSSSSTGPDDQRPVAGYDMPPECGGAVTVSLDQDIYAPDDDGLVEAVDASPLPGASVTLASSSGDALTLALAAVPGGPLLRAPFRMLGGAVDPADGVLQAAPGDTVTATYSGAAAGARVSDGMALSILEYRIYGNWCQMSADDDELPGWYILPGFLDPGEQASVTVSLGNSLADDLENLEVTVTSLSPSVRVLPSAPMALGTVRAQRGTGPQRFVVQFEATGALTATPGELAPIRLDFRSRGRSGSVVLTIELAMDYEQVAGLSPFDNGTETFDGATSSTWNQWSSRFTRGALNSWLQEGCAGDATPSGWHVGEPGCADYGDGQVASTLVSPQILGFPPDAVAFRLVDWSFAIDSALWTDRGSPLCDADFVGLFVTSGPSSFDYSDPGVIYYGGAQRYWRPIYEDTFGWRTQSPFYYSREPQFVIPGADYAALRLQWIFWGDVYDCGFETPNAGRFFVDDVRFTYDIVRKVPETQACAADCVMYAPLVADPPGPKCPGEAFTLRAPGAEQTGCAGTVYYAFGGPGVPAASGWTTTPEAPAVGEDGGYYSLYTQCETQPDCADYRAFTNVSPALPGIGSVLDGTLRVARAGSDVSFRWLGAAAPASYGIWSASTRAELAAGLSAWTLAGRSDREGPRGEGAWRGDAAALGSGLTFFQVAGRDRCTDAPR